MKNCPKCGTVIINNKEICENCGADLTEFNKNAMSFDDGFADNFFAQIGGVVSGEQETAIEEPEMNVDANQLSNKKNIQQQNVFFVDSNKTNESGESFNSILSSYISTDENGVQPEIKTDKNKLFSIEKANKKEEKKPETAQPMMQDENLPPVTMAFDSQIPQAVKVEDVQVAPLAYTPNVIKDDDEYVPPLHVTQRQPIIQQPMMQQPVNQQQMVQYQTQQVPVVQPQQVQVVQQKKGINASLIVNLLGIVVFVGALIFVIFWMKKPSDTHTRLGGLTYNLDSAFALKSDSEGSKYYVYESGCEIRITYGAANSDSFLDSYFNGIRENFKNEENYNFQNDTVKINNNSWSSLSVMEMPNGNVTAPTLRYKYSSIVHNASFYHIVFVNVNNDQECLTMYNDFTNTLDFE